MGDWITPSAEVVFNEATGGYYSDWFHAFIGSVLVFGAFMFSGKLLLEHVKAWLKNSGGVETSDLVRAVIGFCFSVTFIIYLAY